MNPILHGTFPRAVRTRPADTVHTVEELHRNLVEQMQEGAVVLSDAGDILYANARFAAIVGTPLESVIGSAIAPFIHADCRKEFAALLIVGRGKCRSRLIGGESGTFDATLSLTPAVAGRGDRLNLIVTDRSELQQATSNREKAERDSHNKDEFLAMLAHELRNPLGAISNAVRVLELNREEETARRAREVIVRQVAHVSHLINDLLDVERVVSGESG